MTWLLVTVPIFVIHIYEIMFIFDKNSNIVNLPNTYTLYALAQCEFNSVAGKVIEAKELMQILHISVLGVYG